MKVNIEELSEFLVRAKKETYAGNGKEVQSQRPGFKELEYSEGDLNYRDSYSGYYAAPGQEVVRLKNTPIWSIAYSGGIKKEYSDLAHKTFKFLKKALAQVTSEKPFRGPEYFKEGDFEYQNETKGDIKDFRGTEKIFYKEREVFRQDYIGGLIIHRSD